MEAGGKAGCDICTSVGVDTGFGGPLKTSRMLGIVAGCENGFTGPLGPSENDGATAVEGVGNELCWDEPGKGFGKGTIDLSARASWMEGSDLRRSGDSWSSRVERRVVDSGGEIYPDNPEADPAVEGAHEYGAGGPEYMDAVGLANGAVEMLKPLPIENLERSNLETSLLSGLICSTSRWLMEGKVLLRTKSVMHPNRARGHTYLGLEAGSIVAVEVLIEDPVSPRKDVMCTI